MIFDSLDSLTRRYLLERGLPIHFYLETLLHHSTCLKELNFDSLQIVNSATLPVNNYNAIDFPDDLVDVVGLYLPRGGFLQPVPQRASITPIRSHDSTGSFIPSPVVITTDEPNSLTFNGEFFWYWNVSDWGEPTGRRFGAPGNGRLNAYNVIKERRQIQLTGTFTSSTAVVMYISDGQTVDNASKIETAASRTLFTYTDWQRSPRAAIKDSPEARTFYNEKRKLRARLNTLTVTDIIDIIRSTYRASIKS